MTKKIPEYVNYAVIVFFAVILYNFNTIPKAIYFISVAISFIFIFCKKYLTSGMIKKLIIVILALDLIAYIFMLTKKISLGMFTDIDTGLLILPLVTLFTLQYFKNYKEPILKKMNTSQKRRSDIYLRVFIVFLIIVALYISYCVYELLPVYLHQ